MADTIRLAGIVRESITDGPGIRFTVFCQGCPHHCRECHNMETWDPDGGRSVPVSRILEEIDKNGLIGGVTFSGGEPFDQPEAFLSLACEIEKRGLDIVAYTGYLYEELVSMENPAVTELIKKCSLLIDGPYMAERRDLSLRFRGSSNQRIIDVKETFKSGKIVLANEFMVW